MSVFSYQNEDTQMAQENPLVEENQRLRDEIQRLKSGFSTEQQQIVTGREQLRRDREKFEVEAKVVRDYIVALDALRGVLRDSSLNWSR